MPFLITAHPRSATGYTAALLRLLGQDVGHETVGRDGCVSWLHAAPGGSVPWLNAPVTDYAFSPLLHQVRHPLGVIASSVTLTDEAWRYIHDRVGHPGGGSRLRWAMHSYVAWNDLIEKIHPALFYRVEDLKRPETLAAFCDALGVDVPEALPQLPETVNSRPHEPVTWSALKALDKKLYRRVRKLARRYGYLPGAATVAKPVSVSVFMMVKDEEPNLHRCLSSVEDLADEIVVVDTGSADDSVKICESYGAKVFHHPWEDNFSAHRNQGISYATGDWLYQIDADEELCCADPGAFKQWLGRLPEDVSAVALTCEDVIEGELPMRTNMARVFRSGTVHYEKIVHNWPVWTGRPESIRYPEAWFRHYGYDLPADKIRQKCERTIGLLKKRIHDDRQDVHALFLLACAYGWRVRAGGGDADRLLCLKTSAAYIREREKDEHFNTSAYHNAITMALELKQTDRALTILQEAVRVVPEDLDVAMCAVRCGLAAGDPSMVVEGAQRFLTAYDRYGKNPAVAGNAFVYNYTPEALAFCLYYLTVIRLEEGMSALNRFGKVIERTGPAYREAMEKQVSGELARVGITLQSPAAQAVGKERGAA